MERYKFEYFTNTGFFLSLSSNIKIALDTYLCFISYSITISVTLTLYGYSWVGFKIRQGYRP